MVSNLSKPSSGRLGKTLFGSSGTKLSQPASQLLMDADVMLPTETDVKWRAHRVIRGIKTENLMWEFPQTSAEREKGIAPTTEITLKTKFVAIRGIYLRAKFGFGLTQQTDSGYKQVCRTTRLDINWGGDKKVIRDNLPLEKMVRQPHQSKAEPNSLTKVLADVPHYTLYGSRPPVGMPENAKTSTPRTCAECVAAGENFINKDKPGEAKCSGTATVYFVVFQLAALDLDNYDGLSDEVDLIWKTPAEWGLVTIDGDKRTPLDRPFVLAMPGIGTSQMGNLGKGEYDRDIIVPGDKSAGAQYLPPDRELMLFGQFWNKIHSGRNPMFESFTTQEAVDAANFGMYYPFITEIYVGKLKATQFGQNYLPVFSVNPDQSVLGDSSSIYDWVETAVAIENMEYELASGVSQKLNLITDDEDASEVSDATVEPSATVTTKSDTQPTDVDVDVEVEVEVPAETGQVRRKPTSFSAFTSKRKEAPKSDPDAYVGDE